MSIKSCFTSRWEDGYLMEVDFSQLEVVALAILSGDPVLKDDLLSGRDMHRWRASELFMKPEHLVTDKERTLTKRLSFQLQYGAGAKSMAEKNGIAVKTAKKFIENYYNRYKVVKQWQEEIATTIKASRKPSGERTVLGYPKGVGELESATGRLYRFYEYDDTFGNLGDTSFSPTEMKNYPVQGFATADIMALYRGRVYRLLLNMSLTEDVKLINTVHDSVMLDVASVGMVPYVYGLLEKEAERLPELLKTLWEIECDLPFKIECKYGKKWSELKKLWSTDGTLRL